ncbi:MAG: type VI secretion system-associated protein TagF [Rubrivivax sp.]|nr:type VI secretion system-associated protein TagF [Rubrivivax sp.]MCL4698429.1 type VI secretion system-associated protein TagF [Burkholderiaceae bacterium]
MTGPDLAAPGWYGKLATLGDFAGRRVPTAAQQALDRWLSDVVAGSREQLGDDWLDLYLAAPLQRFVLGPRVLGDGWWFGLLMPSCDNVGRYFPLVVLLPRAAPPADGAALAHLGLWWQRVGEAVLETLADEVDVERFDRALAELPPWPGVADSAGLTPELLRPWLQPMTPAAQTARSTAQAPAAAVLQLPADCSPADLTAGLAAAEWQRRLSGASLWWSWRPQGGASTCRLVPGLPTAGDFAAMLAPG